MRIVIFGGSGFVGSYLQRHLKTLGHEVIVADFAKNPDEFNSDYLFSDIRYPINLDITKPIDVAINLAAVHKNPGHEIFEYYETNTLGALNVTEWCKSNGIQKLVFLSSIAVYGDESEIVGESSPLKPVSHYGKSKVIAERIHLNWFESSENHSLVICRPAIVYGSGENGNFYRLLRNLKRGLFVIPFSEETIKAVVYIKDLIRSIELSLYSKERLVVMNVAHPDHKTIREICDVASAIFNYKKAKTLRLELFRRFLNLRFLDRSESVIRARKLSKGFFVSSDWLNRQNFEWEYDLSTSLKDWKETPRLGENF